MKLFGGLLAAALMTTPAWAQSETRVFSAQDVQCGVWSTEAAGVQQGESPTGTFQTRTSPKLVTLGATVPMKTGTEFGGAYHLNGRSPTGTAPIRVRFSYPPGGLRNPDTGERFEYTEDTFEQAFGEVQFQSYIFEYDWEMVPGTWLLQVFHRDRELFQCGFYVVKRDN